MRFLAQSGAPVYRWALRTERVLRVGRGGPGELTETQTDTRYRPEVVCVCVCLVLSDCHSVHYPAVNRSVCRSHLMWRTCTVLYTENQTNRIA
ncbi:hypothetical protein E2C01_086356 [Portunus trituberculatus]|uniref:Uncharacterized protein n=1 Tax=Portunus trituberculatus TaxID=210409 RepID=A0A5B7J927_PORTR|nr:hypothetical protein [Portunus trituberculatus]